MRKRLAAGLLAVLAAVLAPISALALEPAEGAEYRAGVRSAVEKLQAMPGLEIEEETVWEPGPQAEDAPEDGSLIDEMLPMPDEVYDDDGGSLEDALYDAVQDGDGSFYSQLTERQKTCYHALENVPIDQILSASRDQNGHRQVRLSITGIQGITMTGVVSGGNFTPDAQSAEIRKSIFTDLRIAIVALRHDRPDMVWLGDMSYGYSSNRLSNTQIAVTTANYSFSLDFNEMEGEMRSLMMACADVVAQEAAKMPDTYQKIMLIHDVLVIGNTYNHAAADKQISGVPYKMAHCAYSALVTNDSYTPVCDGYSEAFKIICGLLGIPCASATSETHMWNNVKMDDGRWYNLDVTWDDDDRDPINRDYFLIGSQTVIDGQRFCQQRSHIEDNPFSPNSNTYNVVLYYPTKCPDAYQYLGWDYPPLRFPDVGRDAWYFDYVEEAASQNLMKGNSDGWFLPDNPITRAEFAQVIANMVHAQLGSFTGSPFADVPADAWYAPAVSWIKAYGLMQGSGGLFRPEDGISKQEMCVVLYNLAKVQQLDLSPSGTRFSDHGSIAEWAREAVYVCRELGLVQGDNQGALMPESYSVRCVAATMFVRYRDLTGDVTLPWPPPTASPSPTPRPTPTPQPTPTPSPAPTPSPTPGIDATVYWVPGGTRYHSTDACPSLSRSTLILSGTLESAYASGKTVPCSLCH